MWSLHVLVVLLAGCVLSGESALLDSKKCTYGPGYWCDSLHKAKECHAVTHCIQTVWERQQLPVDNDDICTFCKNMVKKARGQILRDETQEEIHGVFKGSCHLIQIKMLADECVHIADNFIPELIETLASEMNPQVVCAAAGLCNSFRIDRLLRDYQENHREESNAIILSHLVQHSQSGDCEYCKDFISRAVHLIKTHSCTELKDQLLALCGQLGSLSDGCMALVETYFENIYKFLTEQLTPDSFCDLIEMCGTRMHLSGFHQRPALQHTGDEPCDFCVTIVEHWRDVLTVNTTEEEFQQILDGLCYQTGKFSKTCLAVVNEYCLPLYNILIAEIHSKEICKAVGLCGFTSVFAQEHPVWTIFNVQEPNTVPLTALEPSVMVDERQDHRMTDADEAVAINFEEEHGESHLPHVPLGNAGINMSPAGTSGVLHAAVGEGHVGGNLCVMCEFAIHFLQKMLEQKDIREDIEEAMEKLCSLMPSSIARECEDYVETYGELVIEFLAQAIDPTKICTMLHTCPTIIEVEESSHGSEITCAICEYAMTQLEDILKDQQTEENIQNALDTLCSYLPKNIEEECQTFVDTYTEQIIQMLINELASDQVCKLLGLCDSTEVSNNNLNSGLKGLKQSTVCVLCEFAMRELDQILLNNTTMSEIISIMDFLCAHLPGTLQDDCIGFVEEYGDAIIALLVHDLDPQIVCQNIKLCKAPSYTGQRAVLNMKLDKCQMCMGTVSYIDERLKEGDFTTTIDTILEEVCRLFPLPAETQCRSLIEVYGPYLVNLLAQLGNPQRVCEGIHFCPADTTEQLLGGNNSL